VSDLVPIKRALISVSDKSGLEPFARALREEFAAELISTGGTARFLRDAGLDVTDVSAVTGFPEMMDGRIKTLHPMIHGGLLAVRDNPQHRAAMEQHGIAPIDLVCINLYPFAQTIAASNVTFEEAIENIDIGGPAMVRSAAKNHRYVLIVTSPDDYDEVLAELRAHGGASTLSLRLRCAQRAFALTAAYDNLIQQYLLGRLDSEQPQQPVVLDAATLGRPHVIVGLRKKQDLRYGENPHQRAALYVDHDACGEASVAHARQFHGKELSYINLLDADAALGVVKELTEPAACIVKHATPCGCAVAGDLPTAFRHAYEGDPLAAFGGIVALNRNVDLATAQAIVAVDKLLEVIVAPSYDLDALDLLRQRWKNVRILDVGPLRRSAGGSNEIHLHKIVGGWLIQQRDLLGVDEANWKLVSRRAPTARELADLKFAWIVCKHIKSNAIAIAKDGVLVGAGAGQQDRVNAARIAAQKAAARAAGAVAASDAFFPFADGPQLLLEAGVTALIQPGGSVRDAETIAAVDARGAAMIFTGQRHFRH